MAADRRAARETIIGRAREVAFGLALSLSLLAAGCAPASPRICTADNPPSVDVIVESLDGTPVDDAIIRFTLDHGDVDTRHGPRARLSFVTGAVRVQVWTASSWFDTDVFVRRDACGRAETVNIVALVGEPDA